MGIFNCSDHENLGVDPLPEYGQTGKVNLLRDKLLNYKQTWDKILAATIHTEVPHTNCGSCEATTMSRNEK